MITGERPERLRLHTIHLRLTKSQQHQDLLLYTKVSPSHKLIIIERLCL